MAGYIVHKAVEGRKVRKPRWAEIVEGDLLNTEYITQPKFDGCNCVVFVRSNGEVWQLTAYSRTGEQVGSMNHVLHLMSTFPNLSEGVYLGEAWHPDIAFQDINGRFRRLEGDDETAELQFAIFDFIPLEDYDNGHTDLPYSARHRILDTMMGPITPGKAPFYLVRGFGVLANSGLGHTVETLAKELRDAGNFDGVICRDINATWTKGDSGTGGEIIKVKPLIRVTGKVTGYKPGKGKHAGKIGTLLVTVNGIEQGAGTGLADNERDINEYASRWSGKFVELDTRGFTKGGKMMEPRLLGVRSDVLEAD